MGRLLPPFAVFYSYAREDAKLLDEFSSHLASMKRENWIEEWFDGDILPGHSWSEHIKDRLRRADIIVFLVSADFIRSEYCWMTELQFALRARKQGVVEVVPVIIRPVDWRRTPLGELHALPSEAKPVTEWVLRDTAWTNVAEGMRRLVVGITQRRMRLRINAIDPSRSNEENKRAAQSISEEVPGHVLATVIDDLADCFRRMQGDPTTQYRLAQAFGACATDAARARVRKLYEWAEHPLARQGLDDALGEA